MANPQKVAVLVHEGYQDLEFWYPLLRLREEGTPVTVVGGEPDKVYFSQLEYPVIADLGIGEAEAKDFHTVVVPGGAAAGHIAREPRMMRFVVDAAASGALLAATAEGVSVLAAAGALVGKRIVVDTGEPVVTDAKLITARSTNDLPAFCRAMFAALAAGR